jgi:hypothetical protein
MTSLTLSQAPQTRSRAKKEAEKPNSLPDKNLFDSTPLKSLYVDGMDEEQIWEQLDLRTTTICRVLDFVLEGESEAAEQKDGNSIEGEGEYDARLLKALEDLEREGFDLDDLMGEESESSSGQSSSSPSGSDVEDDEGEENYSSLRDPSEDEDEDGEVESPVLHSLNQSSRKKKGKNAAVSELDDDFFNLAEFNAESERAEARSSSKGRLAEDDESDEDMEIDLFASVDPVENFDEEDLEGNPDGTCLVSHNVIYADGYSNSQLYSITIFSKLPSLHRQLLKRSRKCSRLVQAKSVSMTRFASRKLSHLLKASHYILAKMTTMKMTVYLLAEPKSMTMRWSGVTRMKKWRMARKRRRWRRRKRKRERERKRRKMTIKMRGILNLAVGKQSNV